MKRLVILMLLGVCAGATATGTPAPAAEVPGITDAEIIIGAHSPLSGPYGSVYAMIPRAQEAYYR